MHLDKALPIDPKKASWVLLRLLEQSLISFIRDKHRDTLLSPYACRVLVAFAKYEQTGDTSVFSTELAKFGAVSEALAQTNVEHTTRITCKCGTSVVVPTKIRTGYTESFDTPYSEFDYEFPKGWGFGFCPSCKKDDTCAT